DKDFIRFTATQSGPLSVHVTTETGALASLQIEDNAGRKVLETQPNNGIHSAIGNLVAGRTYFVRLRSTTNNAAAYEARLLFGSGEAFADDDAPLGSATPVRFNQNGLATFTGTSKNHDDKLYFAFTAPTTGAVNVNITFTNRRPSRLKVEDRTGTTLFETQPNDGVNSGSFAVREGTVYFIRVRAVGDAPASFRVQLQLVG
ncbi:MAG: hypothetical protein NZO58_06425, partial [Gemmataceae bacterium]|nr:hypothetical protein [Gemmataceae bacterium]